MFAPSPSPGTCRARNLSIGSCSSTTSVFSVKSLHADAMMIAGAPWVPDEASDECMVCHVAFSAFRRKHHCRSCGALVCSSCSKGRIRIDGEEHKSRVCDICQRRDLPPRFWQEWVWSIELLRSDCRTSLWWSYVMKKLPAIVPSLEGIESNKDKTSAKLDSAKFAQDLHQIQIDTDRTFNMPRQRGLAFQSSTGGARGKDMAMWRAALQRVLKAYAMQNPVVGYCQGMDYIAAILLYGSKWDCSYAFRLLYVLMEVYELKGIYAPGLPLLNARFYQLDELLHTHLPELHEHLVEHHMHPNVYASGWIMTLFANFHVLPPRVVLRFFDFFFSKGWKSFFRVALAILALSKPKLLLAHNTVALLEILHELHNLVPESDDKVQSFFTLAMSFKVTNAKLRVLEDQFNRESHSGTFLDEDLMQHAAAPPKKQ
ncbi:Aste57867_1383 [Aphanomyces stellatus]|uniref:Aste57867_1383 protein n=1 Tax=Aphanomyces stellatus TaxID=120398 RepID=A0A485K560_9STRA|nr:hypothetical protein As57867_001382 [Aphanomyces stellatus]VFT78600.1 Aste57867_1383 [Aphanomyces stellatus]